MNYLLRHGHDDEDYVGGWSNAKLTEQGIKEVHEVGLFLVKTNHEIKRIYTSDIHRAIMTANIIGSYLKVEVIATSDLRELNKGLLTGLPVDTAKQQYPEYFDNITIDTRYPNGESLKDLYERVRLLLKSNIMYSDNNLLISHRGVINMIYTILSGHTLDYNKAKYNVNHASLHEFDNAKKLIKKIR